MKGQELAALRARVEALEGVLSEAYQLAGAVGAPERVLDNLAAAAAGRPLPHATFLPVTPEECQEVAALLRRLAGAEDGEDPRAALAGILGRTGGRVRSRVKAAASRANGAKGGRPRKKRVRRPRPV